MFIIWDNDNLLKILGKLERVLPDHFLRIDTEWPCYQCDKWLCWTWW